MRDIKNEEANYSERWIGIHKHCRFIKLTKFSALLKNVAYYQEENGVIEILYLECNFISKTNTKILNLLTINSDNSCTIEQISNFENIVTESILKITVACVER